MPLNGCNSDQSDKNLQPPSTNKHKNSNLGNSGRNQSVTESIRGTTYADVHKFGMTGDDSEEDDPDILAAVEDSTPITKRRVIKEENIKKVKKLGPYATAFTIFKGFVCTGILYMPKDFINGGWLFSAICILCALFLTLYCAKLLLEVSEAT